MSVTSKILSSRSQTQKSSCYVIPLIQSTKEQAVLLEARILFTIGEQYFRKESTKAVSGVLVIQFFSLSAHYTGVFGFGKFVEPVVQFSIEVFYCHRRWKNAPTERGVRVVPRMAGVGGVTQKLLWGVPKINWGQLCVCRELCFLRVILWAHRSMLYDLYSLTYSNIIFKIFDVYFYPGFHFYRGFETT